MVNMSRQHLTRQVRQTIPSPTRAGPSRPSTSIAPNTAESSSSAGLKSSSFWAQEGMTTFLDWLTDPNNYARLQKKNPFGGPRSDIYKEICQLVNNKHNTSWTETQVQAKITYTKTKYYEAFLLNSTGKLPVLQKPEEICPLFTRLHAVLGGSLSANHPHPRQTGRREGETISSEVSEEESSDLEECEAVSFAEANTGHYNIAHPSKRRKGKGLTFSKLNATMLRVQQFLDQQHHMYDQGKAEVRAREQEVEQREREMTEKLLRMADDSYKRAEEARVQLRLELAAERAELKKEMALDRAEIRQEREDFKRERAQFMNERAELKVENSALKKELEVRNRLI